MGPALWPQRWELLYSRPIGMKVWRYEGHFGLEKNPCNSKGILDIKTHAIYPQKFSTRTSDRKKRDKKANPSLPRKWFGRRLKNCSHAISTRSLSWVRFGLVNRNKLILAFIVAALRSRCRHFLSWFRFLYLHQTWRRVGMFDQPIWVH